MTPDEAAALRLAQIRDYVQHKLQCQRGRVVRPVKCPDCGEGMLPVRNDSGCLNQYQFDAVKAGDWFCKRHDAAVVYVWDCNLPKQGCTCGLDEALAALARAEQTIREEQEEKDSARVEPSVDCVATAGSTAEGPMGAVTAAERTDLRWVNDIARMLTRQALWHEKTPFQQEQMITREYLLRIAAGQSAR